MVATDTTATAPTGAEDVAWDIDTLVGAGDDPAGAVDALLDGAFAAARAITEEAKGTVHRAAAPQIAAMLERLAQLLEDAHRADNYAQLRFSTDTAEPERGALVQKVTERLSELSALLVWFELEWMAIGDERANYLLADPELAQFRHHLETLRIRKDNVLSEPEEQLLATIEPTATAAWVRLFTEQTSAIEVTVPSEGNEGETMSLDGALARLAHPDRDVRRSSADAVTAALQPGLRTRAYIFNTLLASRRIDDGLRGYPTWISARNQANEASDESVAALIEAVVGRYELPRRWYRLKAKALGLDRLADFDRSASVAETETRIEWDEATTIVRDAYQSFSPELAEVVDRFLREGWIDAPVRPAKQGGAFCAYTVPSHHPYVFLNFTATANDVMTLAHELGHGVHAYLARPRGIFAQTTPLTLAETASVFGETVTFNRLLERLDDPAERFALLAQNVEGAIGTVFRQVAMNRFEDAVHTHRREKGELSTDDFAEHWASTQADLFGDAMEVTDGYRDWWSYIPHFIFAPGYVYAYAYGQLLALSVYARYAAQGDSFVPQYLQLLAAGGSARPEELGQIVDCDLADPAFWSAGLDIIDSQIGAAEEAAIAAGRI